MCVRVVFDAWGAMQTTVNDFDQLTACPLELWIDCVSLCVCFQGKKNTAFAVFGGTIITATLSHEQLFSFSISFRFTLSHIYSTAHLIACTFLMNHGSNESELSEELFFSHTSDDARYTDYYFLKSYQMVLLRLVYSIPTHIHNTF